MLGFVIDLEKTTNSNTNFRQVLYTAKNCQLVIMSLKAGEQIGEETHHLDQFIKVEKGQGVVILNGDERLVEDGYGVVIPAGVMHNVINTGSEDLKIYSLYSPPEHRDGVIHVTKEDADKAEESGGDEFDGITSE